MRKYYLFIALFLFAALSSCQKKEKFSFDKEDFDSLMGKDLPQWQHVQTPEDFENLHFYRSLFLLNREYLKQPSMDVRIPKVIHFIWLGPKPFPRDSIDNVRSWIGRHPDWTVKFWTDRDRPLPHPKMEQVLVERDHFSKLSPFFYDSDNFGEKSDLLRLEILHSEGGVYVDHDVRCFRSFDLFNDSLDFFCGLEVPYKTSLSSSIHPTNNILAAKAHHPLIDRCIDWLERNWDAIGRQYPGKDRDAVIDRVSHRTFYVLGKMIKEWGNINGNRDMVFPAFYFNAPKDEWALYARHQYAGTWFENETVFEKMTRERLMYLSKKSNKILLACGVMAALNFLGFIFLFILFKRCLFQTKNLKV